MSDSEAKIFSLLRPEDIVYYWQLRKAMSKFTNVKTEKMKRVMRRLRRDPSLYKLRALHTLLFLASFPALSIDINGLCYVVGIPYGDSCKRNIEIWLKKIVEGKDSGRVAERVEVRCMRHGTNQSMLLPLKAPNFLGMIYPRMDVTIERGYRLPRSKWAYKLRIPSEYDKALYFMDLTCELQLFGMHVFKMIGKDGLKMLALESFFFVWGRLIDLMVKCGLKMKDRAELLRKSIETMSSDFATSLQDWTEDVPLIPDPSEALKERLPRLVSIGSEWVLECCNCFGDNMIETAFPKQIACGFCGMPYRMIQPGTS